MKKLPVGQQDFERLILKDCIYVDKTYYIHQLMESGGVAFFLSRPRRFGKSLLLSTIQAIFEGKKELFKGLYIEDKIDWESYPVIKLDMSRLDTTSLEYAQESLLAILEDVAINYDFNISLKSPKAYLGRLINLLSKQTGKQVVLLVDEYDKGILDVIEDKNLANGIREMLQNFYTILKASADSLKFLMLTGVAKISQASIFSGLNQYIDITLQSKYAGICGYTQQELEYAFGSYMVNLTKDFGYTADETLRQIKYWYNGYSWDGSTFVYNPFSVLLLFENGRFKDYWFGTGTPSFLLKLLKSKNNLRKMLNGPVWVSETFADGQMLEKLDTISLLFQTGYLTIKSFDTSKLQGRYELLLPNEEVKRAISELVLIDGSKQDKTSVNELSNHIRDGFTTGNTSWAIENLDILFSNISYNTSDPNKNESHYHALFQLTMIMAGIDHQAERYNAIGRTDGVLRFRDRQYVIEFKYAKDKDALPKALAKAWEQIKRNEYAKPYLNQGKTLHVVALAFTKGKIAFEEEIIEP